MQIIFFQNLQIFNVITLLLFAFNIETGIYITAYGKNIACWCNKAFKNIQKAPWETKIIRFLLKMPAAT
jgi:hypothetical protein